MNRPIGKISILFFLLTLSIYPQVAKDSWSLGFGVAYPRFMSISSLQTGAWAGIGNYGGYAELQRDFSEHVGLRLKGSYNYMKTESSTYTQWTNLAAVDLDMLYSFVPCEVISPYLAIGFGGIGFNNTNSPQKYLDVTYIEYEFNLGFGAEWHFSDNWSLTAEGIYHTSSTNKLDGYENPGEDKGLFGGNADTYITLGLGLQFYFSKGEPSPLCDLYEGIKTNQCPCLSLDDIEALIVKHIPKEIVKKEVVEKPVEVKPTHWVLVGVNFEFNSAQLTAQSYPILFYAVQNLNDNPDIKVEIQGHTDNIGSNEYNMKLSQRRAETVRDYLVSKGIDPSRLTVKGYGETMPIADNNTPEGRALNRRIEFKILNK